jgi:hypothetical protein
MHSWGTAIDLSIGDTLPPPRQGKTLYGFELLAPFFEKEGFVWGADDGGMHFEVSEQTLQEWKQDGRLE